MGILSQQVIKKVLSEMSPKAILAIAIAAVLVCGGSAFAIARYFKTHHLRPPQRIEEISTVLQSSVPKHNLVTACYYEDVVVHGKKSDLKETAERNAKGNIINPKNEIVAIQGAIVRAGIDVSQMNEKNFRFEGDSILFITIPEPVLMGVVKDVENFEVFSRSGTWKIDQVQELIKAQTADLEKKALDAGLLDRAYDNAVNLFAKFFKSPNFRVEFSPRSIPAPKTE